MSEIKVMIVGVSDYSKITGATNLSFCKNDIEAVKESLIKGLKVKENNIIELGKSEIVNKQDFIKALNLLGAKIEKEDTFIFYFSGHGTNQYNKHYLVLSDGILNTQELIEVFDKIPAKNKIILLDSCMSGNFKVSETATMSDTFNLEEFVEKGYAVISSSSAMEYSYGHPSKPISLFTSFLCEALTDKYLVKKGKKSLYDIQKLLFMYLEIWNIKNPDRQQNPIFRANMGGTILFAVEEYISYKVKNYYLDTPKYIIYSVKPMHVGIAKRYSVQVILKEPLSLQEVATVNQEIIDKIKDVEIYQNELAEARWKGRKTNIIFCYFGRDESDIINSNYICHTTWVDETQNREHWYRLCNDCEIIENIHFNIHGYYSSLKVFNDENTGDKNTLIIETKKIISELISLAEKVIGLYNEFINKTMNEQELVIAMEPLIHLIDKWYFAEGDLDIPPKEIKSWCQSCSNLAATIHDFTLFYNEQYLSSRTEKNRKECMNLTIKRYYFDLDQLKAEEKKYGQSINESID